MLVSSKKKKGKTLEKFVASAYEPIFGYAYSRADSGSGKHHKEDVTVPFNIPIHTECKKQAELKLGTWWQQTLEGCPQNKIPVLIYSLDYTPLNKAQVYMNLGDVMFLLSGVEVKMPYHVTITFEEYIAILQESFAPTRLASEDKQVIKDWLG